LLVQRPVRVTEHKYLQVLMLVRIKQDPGQLIRRAPPVHDTDPNTFDLNRLKTLEGPSYRRGIHIAVYPYEIPISLKKLKGRVACEITRMQNHIGPFQSFFEFGRKSCTSFRKVGVGSYNYFHGPNQRFARSFPPFRGGFSRQSPTWSNGIPARAAQQACRAAGTSPAPAGCGCYNSRARRTYRIGSGAVYWRPNSSEEATKKGLSRTVVSESVSITPAEPQGGIPVLKVAGTLNAYNFQQLEKALNELFEQGHATVLVDLAELQYVSSAGVGVFVGAAGRAQARGGTVAIVRPRTEVREIFDLLGVGHIIPVASSFEEALQMIAETLSS